MHNIAKPKNNFKGICISLGNYILSMAVMILLVFTDYWLFGKVLIA
jgi:hypothetical protein